MTSRYLSHFDSTRDVLNIVGTRLAVISRYLNHFEYPQDKTKTLIETSQ